MRSVLESLTVFIVMTTAVEAKSSVLLTEFVAPGISASTLL